MSERTYANQFGADYAVPAEIIALVQGGALLDTSWGNDTCPSFETTSARAPVALLLDHPEPSKREFSTASRFTIVLLSHDNEGLYFVDEDSELLLATEALEEVLAFLTNWR